MAQYFDNVDLKSEIRKFDVDVLNYKMIFYSDNGVFCKEHLDYGTKLLLTSIPWKEVTGNILDVGCGYGPIGIFASKVTGNSVTMCDINKRALHLAKMNIKENNVDIHIIESNCYENIHDKLPYLLPEEGSSSFHSLQTVIFHQPYEFLLLPVLQGILFPLKVPQEYMAHMQD